VHSLQKRRAIPRRKNVILITAALALGSSASLWTTPAKAASGSTDGSVSGFTAVKSPPGQSKGQVQTNLAYHKGRILPTVVTKAIFWGASWDKKNFIQDKITGIDSFYNGYSDSRYAQTGL
jgi:hypothetical protein